MEIILDKIDSVNAQIKIKLNQADYQPHVEKKLKDYSRTAAIKGFRPGKVPPAMIQKIYGKSVKINEINDLAVKSLQDYIQTNELQIFAAPLLEANSAKSIDWDTQKDFEFTYEIGLQPDFKVEAASLKPVTTYEVNLTDATVDKYIENLRRMHGGRTSSEASQKGDFIFGTLEQVSDGTKSAAHIKVDDIPAAIQEAFLGKKAEDVITFDLREALPNNTEISKVLRISEEEAEKLSGQYTLTVRESFSEQLAELNEEFFSKLSGEGTITSEEQLREYVRETLTRKYSLESNSLIVRNFRQSLLDSIAIELPVDFLKKWLIHSNEQINESNVEEVFARYQDELKWDMIRTHMAEELKMGEVAPEEFLQRVKDMYFLEFLYSNMIFMKDDLLQMFAQSFLTDQKNRDRQMGIYNVLMTEKIWENIKADVKEDKQTLTSEEFDNLKFD